MSAQLFYNPQNVLFTSRSLPAGAASVYFFHTGTTSLAPIYSDVGLTTPLQNPVPADGLGRLPNIYMDSATLYRVRAVDGSGAPMGLDTDPYIPGTTGDAAAQAAAGAAAASALAAKTSETNAHSSEINAGDSATAAASSAQQAALAAIAAGSYPNSAASNVPRGLTQASVGAITAGSGGTNGTFALAWSSGNFTVNPTGTFTVAGGVLTAVTITGPGLYIGASPTVPTPSFAASSGLTGAAVVLTAQFLVPSGEDYWVQSVDGQFINNYTNNSGTPLLTAGISPIATSLLASLSKSFSGYTISDSDATGPKVLLSGDSTGIAAKQLSTTYLNGRDAETVLRDTRRAVRMPFDIGHIMSDGQSLNMAGVGGGTFDIPDARSFAWPFQQANPSQGTETAFLATSIVNNGIKAGSSPSLSIGVGPWHGAVAMLRFLLEHEEGIDPSEQPLLYLGNNAAGSTAISAHIKGTTPYNVCQQQALATRTYARNNKQRGRLLGKLWGQGEADSGLAGLSYYNALLLLAQNDAADYRATATEQDFDPLLVTYQTASEKGTNRWGVARAQHKLAVDYPNLIGFSNALYHLNYSYDYGGYPAYNSGGLHPPMYDAFVEGLDYGLALKRKLFDGLPFLPIRPVSVATDGNVLFVTFALRKGKRLAIDTTTVPAQPNWGIAAYNENTSSTITMPTAPSLCRDFATLAFDLGAAPVAGMRIDVGQGGVGMYPYSPGSYAGNGSSYIGAATNIRDDYTLRYKYAPLGFDIPLYDRMPIMSIRLTNTAPGFELLVS